MPLGIISNEELEAELNNLPKAVIKDMPNQGRPEGRKEVPEDIRKIISEEALEGVQSRELQQLFGISASSVAAYKNGATSTASYNEGNGELKVHVNKVKERIIARAESKLGRALKAMTPEKFEKAKLRDLAGVAREMSAVVKNMEPERPEQNQQLNAQFVFMVPQLKKEQDYDVIDVEN